MLPWLIIGGGLHGTHLSLVLTKECGVDPKHVRVLDPEPEPLAQWFHNTRNTGMTHLRSPVVHHLDLEPDSLRKFAKNWHLAKPFIAPYARPSLSLFNAHCRDVIERNGLDQLRIQGVAKHVESSGNHVVVETDAGPIRAKRVVMAMGSSPISIPQWAQDLANDGGVVHHLFERGFTEAKLEKSGTTLVVGGGISGAQFASRLVELGAKNVVILARSKPRVHQFDSDPGWLGPKYMNRFSSLKPTSRRPLITTARHIGSMPSDVNRRLRGHMKDGRITWVEGFMDSARVTDKGCIIVTTAGETIEADRLVLATGFKPTLPAKNLVDHLHQQANLPIAPCGFPITDRFLRWNSRIFVAGGQGELTLGPVARNIAGARRAGNLIKRFIGAS